MPTASADRTRHNRARAGSRRNKRLHNVQTFASDIGPEMIRMSSCDDSQWYAVRPYPYRKGHVYEITVSGRFTHSDLSRSIKRALASGRYDNA